MKLNLNFPLKDLNGNPIKTESLGKIIGNTLAMGQSDNPIKVFFIAQKLYKDGEIDLDASDLDLLRAEIAKNQTFTNILKAQVLEKIDEAKLNNTKVSS